MNASSAISFPFASQSMSVSGLLVGSHRQSYRQTGSPSRCN